MGRFRRRHTVALWAAGTLGPTAFLEESIRTYRYDLGHDQPDHVEIWAEKDAIVSVLLDAADPLRVQVMPFRGFTSLTSLYNAAMNFKDRIDEGKEISIYYFGDHDPSGVAIDAAAQKALRDDFDVDISFHRVAVTPQQIAQYNLPTRPTKATDSRAKKFVGESVEIDAMPRDVLLDLVTSRIMLHLPADVMQRLEATERAQRASLQTVLDNLNRRTV